MPLERLVGVALFALGIASLPSTSAQASRSVVIGLLPTISEQLLYSVNGHCHNPPRFYAWAGVILNFIVAGALLPQLLARRPPFTRLTSSNRRRNK